LSGSVDVNSDIWKGTDSLFVVSSSGDIKIQPQVADSFKATVSDYGDIPVIDLQSINVQSEIKGSGSVFIEGTLASQSTSVSGSGDF